MKKRSRIGYILQEIAIVVIGVLIAVSIGNYKENADNEKYLEKTLLAIENEIILSKAEVDTVLNKHLILFEILDEEMGNNDQTLSELISSSGGFQIASIKNVSLRFFISNKAELLEFQLISQLLDIESQTDVLSDKIKRLADFVNENLNERNDDVKIKFAHLLADVIDGEQTLLEAYHTLTDGNENYLKKE
jgi:hypothetical protein